MFFLFWTALSGRNSSMGQCIPCGFNPSLFVILLCKTLYYMATIVRAL